MKVGKSAGRLKCLPGVSRKEVAGGDYDSGLCGSGKLSNWDRDQSDATVFAKNGYLTLAPDFLGYGESDIWPDNTLEDRFLTPVTVLQLIASVKNLKRRIRIKSRFGDIVTAAQIALAVLEISGKKYPTSLWAPVSKAVSLLDFVLYR